MKKLAIFFLVMVIVIVGISYLYLNYKANYYEAKKQNQPFESYEGQEFYGTEVATLINRAVNQNETNEVVKDEKGRYKDNQKDSIQIKVKMLDDNKTYDMEILYQGGMDQFVKYYGEIIFKCTKIEYHTTNKVKKMLLEQITE